MGADEETYVDWFIHRPLNQEFSHIYYQALTKLVY